ncbi:hypothetical protein D5S17_05955 [Pseudonocardiaceae bacterium YIM PH 21723]|nr:hypothetical protein D5S17_05955 [Pseudonocardiaceae bacterium YIM PH 21723]
MPGHIRMLGSVDICGDGGPWEIGHVRQRAVLAALAAAPARRLSSAELAWWVWGDLRPMSAAATLYRYIHRLRRHLEQVPGLAIERGYRLVCAPEQIDHLRFSSLVRQARATRDRALAIRLYGDALRLWQDEPCAGLETPAFVSFRQRLTHERDAAELDYVDLLLGEGVHAELLPGLHTRRAERPFDERLAGQLMLALSRGGRSADALDQYRRFRDRMITELGREPGRHLRDLQRRILGSADPGFQPG